MHTPDARLFVVVTGEGAIEGSVEDYIVASPFATDFKYGRFNKLVAPPRDTSELNSPLGKAKAMMRGARASAASDAE